MRAKKSLQQSAGFQYIITNCLIYEQWFVHGQDLQKQ